MGLAGDNKLRCMAGTTEVPKMLYKWTQGGQGYDSKITK